jgi:hypothetical protein
MWFVFPQLRRFGRSSDGFILWHRFAAGAAQTSLACLSPVRSANKAEKVQKGHEEEFPRPRVSSRCRSQKVARDLHHPWCDLIGAASIPCGCSDPDLPLLDAFKGAILASKTVEVAVR